MNGGRWVLLRVKDDDGQQNPPGASAGVADGHVIRELVVNTFAHRDWTRQNDIRLVVYRDPMEETKPGALPNGMTVEKMKGGQRTSRNANLVRILRGWTTGIRASAFRVHLRHWTG